MSEPLTFRVCFPAAECRDLAASTPRHQPQSLFLESPCVVCLFSFNVKSQKKAQDDLTHGRARADRRGSGRPLVRCSASEITNPARENGSQHSACASTIVKSHQSRKRDRGNLAATSTPFLPFLFARPTSSAKVARSASRRAVRPAASDSTK